jgi:chromosome segregation ATPase
MSIVAKRTEFGDPRNSFSAATFRKVLKGFEIGGLPYTEVQFQLKRLLATGVSPGELREVLRRSELIEPLPEYAYQEVLGLLDDAIEQDAALQSDPDGAIEPTEELDPVALAAELQDTREALEAEQTRVREAEEALSVRITAEEAVRSRLDITLRESERYQAELRATRNSIASRDKVTAQMRQTLDERDAELAAMRREHAELAAVRAEIERSLTDSNSLSGATRERLASQEKLLADLRQSLAERDARLHALKREHAESLSSIESRDKGAAQLQTELQAARAQATSLAAELEATRGALESERRKNQERSLQDQTLVEARQMLAQRDAQLVVLKREHTETRTALESNLQASRENLHVAQRRAVAANTDLDGVRAQVANLQSKLRDSNALIEKLGASVRSEAKRATQWQAAAQQRVSEAAAALPQVEVLPPAQAAHVATLLPKFAFDIRGWRWNLRATPRPLWIGAATVLLAAAIWFALHRPSPAPTGSPTSSTALLQPVPPAVPTDRVEDAPALTENGSTIEKPAHSATAPAATKAATATVGRNSDFQRCRAGALDACYDAIRWKPSDPSLLSALGDALLRANRPADALRTYQRVATLAPNLPGVAAKISAIEAKLSAKRAAQTQSH